MFECGAAKRNAFALRIRPERPAAIRTFLPFEAEPFQILVHRGNEFGLAPSAIKIFVAEN